MVVSTRSVESLSVFMDRNLASAREGSGVSQYSQTSLFSVLNDIVRNEQATEATLAGIIWQIVTSSLSFAFTLWNESNLSISDPDVSTIVVVHGEGWQSRYNLLVLCPRYEHSSPLNLNLDLSPKTLQNGYER